jgi:hypothetical protein
MHRSNNPRSGGRLRFVFAWLLSVVLVFSMVYGQASEARSIGDHHTSISIDASDVSTKDSSPSPACHPGVTCAAFFLPEGHFAAVYPSVGNVLRPDLTQSQLRFTGPAVTLPPPRILI